MKLKLLAAGQGVYSIKIDGKTTGYNAVNINMKGKWRIRKDCRDPHNDPHLMLLVDREVTHLIHRPEAFAEFVQSNPEWKTVIVPRINSLEEVDNQLRSFTADDIGNFETYARANDGECDGVYTITYVSTEGDTTQQDDQ